MNNSYNTQEAADDAAEYAIAAAILSTIPMITITRPMKNPSTHSPAAQAALTQLRRMAGNMRTIAHTVPNYRDHDREMLTGFATETTLAADALDAAHAGLVARVPSLEAALAAAIAALEKREHADFWCDEIAEVLTQARAALKGRP